MAKEIHLFAILDKPVQRRGYTLDHVLFCICKINFLYERLGLHSLSVTKTTRQLLICDDDDFK